jgi:LysR family transcriptional regulator, benzoate and cis,cis-muconate-responsive activator of ben and cat genes
MRSPKSKVKFVDPTGCRASPANPYFAIAHHPQLINFVGMSERTYPGSNEWLIHACRAAGFTPRILQDADGEPAVISFVAAGLGVALLPEQIKRLPHEGVIFLPLRRRLIAESWAVWKVNNSSSCLKQYMQIVRDLS